jgi:Bifunctional DNA primase/polymerase, N-terminal
MPDRTFLESIDNAKPRVDAAIAYVALGWRLIPLHTPTPTTPCDCRRPCVSPAKHPRTEHGLDDATADEPTIRRWWSLWPRANIGVATGGLFDAFDVEAAHLPALREAARRSGEPWPVTPLARTGRGGIHVLTRPTGTGATRKLYLDGTHIGELKSAGGYIVVAPSSTVGAYEWLVPPDHEFADAPAWLRAMIGRPAAGPARPPWVQVSLAPGSDLEPLARFVAQARFQNRNSALWWAAGRARGDGVPCDLAEAALVAAYLETMLPGENRIAYERAGVKTFRSGHR